ncbi:Katanin p60 ATPase-containing subunit A-like 2 [Taenia solium]|eukprot:TsM_000825100 transcript=TsM_000825100 gene=TsM_000825100
MGINDSLFRFVNTAEAFRTEANVDFDVYTICDNIDLDTILMEFESFYFVKFSKYPRISRKKDDLLVNNNQTKQSLGSGSNKTRLPRSTSTKPRKTNETSAKEDTKNYDKAQPLQEPLLDLVAEGRVINKVIKDTPLIDYQALLSNENNTNCDGQSPQERILKPLGLFAGYSPEWAELAQTISRDIYSRNPNVHWDDIVGLETAKRLVKEAVVYPISYPELFLGILSPWKGLLLYGPPGTGKTLLAKAVATECKTTFFNISASSIVSKWRGDSEKLVRVLFEMARFHAPSTIFLDELDSLMSQRGCDGGSTVGMGEHEGSRRMKTELLIQMDGLAKSDDLVFLLAASNIPWELDHAVLRRLEKRILVDLPNFDARKRMFENLLPPNQKPSRTGVPQLTAQIDYTQMAELTEGYSGSDIHLVCKEAAMNVVRKVFSILDEAKNSQALLQTKLLFDSITSEDVQSAIRRTKPSGMAFSDKYRKWQEKFGSS